MLLPSRSDGLQPIGTSVDPEALRVALQLLCSSTDVRSHFCPPGSEGSLLRPLGHRSELLGWWQVLTAAALMLVNIGLLMLLQLNLHVHLAFAIIGCVLQLTILGYIVTYLSELHRSWPTLLYAVMAIVMATMEAVSRPNHTYTGMRVHMLATISGSSALVFLFCMLLVLQLPADNVLQPQYLIPLFGLLVGHVISGISAGVTTALEELAAGRERVEVLLALGASRLEATRSTVQHAATSALLPIMEQMSVVGLVALPSFMAGQLIQGAEPMQAAKYQIVVMFLIAAASGLGSIAAIYMAVCTLLDSQHRLRLERLQYRRQPHAGYILMLVAIAKQAYLHTRKLIRRLQVSFSRRHPRSYPRRPPHTPFPPSYHSHHTHLHPTGRDFLTPSPILGISQSLETDSLYDHVLSPASSNLHSSSMLLQTTSLATSVAHSPTAPMPVNAGVYGGVNGAASYNAGVYGGVNGAASYNVGGGGGGGGSYAAGIASAAAAVASSALAGSERLRQWLVGSFGRGGYVRSAGGGTPGPAEEGYSHLQAVINPHDDSAASDDGSYSDTYPIIDPNSGYRTSAARRSSTGDLPMPPLATP